MVKVKAYFCGHVHQVAFRSSKFNLNGPDSKLRPDVLNPVVKLNSEFVFGLGQAFHVLDDDTTVVVWLKDRIFLLGN